MPIKQAIKLGREANVAKAMARYEAKLFGKRQFRQPNFSSQKHRLESAERYRALFKIQRFKRISESESRKANDFLKSRGVPQIEGTDIFESVSFAIAHSVPSSGQPIKMRTQDGRMEKVGNLVVKVQRDTVKCMAIFPGLDPSKLLKTYHGKTGLEIKKTDAGYLIDFFFDLPDELRSAFITADGFRQLYARKSSEYEKEFGAK